MKLGWMVVGKSRAKHQRLSNRAVFLFVLLLCSAGGWASAQDNSWDSLRELNEGQTIEVVEMSLKTHRGEFVSVTDQALSLFAEKQSVTCDRQNILRVTLHKPSHRVRNTLIGAVAGGTAGYFLRTDSTRAGATVPMGAIGGATVAVMLPTGGSKLLYRAVIVPGKQETGTAPATMAQANVPYAGPIYTKQSKKGRILGTILGGALGFAGGVAIDVNRNFYDTNALYLLAGTVAGIAAGYFIGNALDKRTAKTESANMKQIQEEAARLRSAESVQALASNPPAPLR